MQPSLDAAILHRADARGGVVDDPTHAPEAPDATDGNAPADAAVSGADGRTTDAVRDPDTVDVIRDGVVMTIDRDDLADLLASDAIDDFRTGEYTVLKARCDDLARRIIRDGGDVTFTRLARDVGTAPATLKKLMATSMYREVFNRVSDEILGTIDDAIIDERRDVMTRGDALQRRALTLLGEAMAISRAHMDAVKGNPSAARPSLIQAGIDAAAEVRQVVTSRAAIGAPGATVNVIVNRQQALVIGGALAESGVDLSDILGGFTTRDAPASTEAA